MRPSRSILSAALAFALLAAPMLAEASPPMPRAAGASTDHGDVCLDQHLEHVEHVTIAAPAIAELPVLHVEVLTTGPIVPFLAVDASSSEAGLPARPQMVVMTGITSMAIITLRPTLTTQHARDLPSSEVAPRYTSSTGSQVAARLPELHRRTVRPLDHTSA